MVPSATTFTASFLEARTNPSEPPLHPAKAFSLDVVADQSMFQVMALPPEQVKQTNKINTKLTTLLHPPIVFFITNHASNLIDQTHQTNTRRHRHANIVYYKLNPTDLIISIYHAPCNPDSLHNTNYTHTTSAGNNVQSKRLDAPLRSPLHRSEDPSLSPEPAKRLSQSSLLQAS